VRDGRDLVGSTSLAARRQPHGDESQAPTVNRLQFSPQDEAKHAAQRDPGHVDPHGEGPPRTGEEVGHEGRRRGRRRGATDAHGGTAEEQLPEPLDQRSQNRERAPSRHPPGQHGTARAQVAQDSEGERSEREHQHVGGGQPPGVCVPQPKIPFDGLEQGEDDVAIDEAEDVDRRQQTQGVERIAQAPRSRARASWHRGRWR